VKYNLYINQVMAVKLGMNVNQSLVFDLLTRSPIWATPIEIDDEYYWWVSRQSICRELELLKMKPDTAYRHLKALADLKLIDYKKEGLKDCIAITELGKSYVGNKSEESRKQIREGSEIIPIYPTSSNNTTSILYTPGFEKFWDVYPKHKTDKKKVFTQKWKKQKLEPMADELVADVLLRINESEKWGEGIICHPRRYLEEERWTEPLDKKKNKVGEESFEDLHRLAVSYIQEKKRIEVA